MVYENLVGVHLGLYLDSRLSHDLVSTETSVDCGCTREYMYETSRCPKRRHDD